jgi:DNA-binding CsgD family transcriptional regulator
MHDHDRIEAMIELGFPAARIAARLGCSERTARRVAEERDLALYDNPLIGTPDERSVLWQTYKNCGCSDARIAYLFGRSRQAVAAHFAEGQPQTTAP